MKRFLQNAYRETKTTAVGLLLLALGLFVALQDEMDVTLKTTLSVALVTAGIGGLAAKDHRKGGARGPE
ncbi:hypothetical protein [Larkinella humicola]|uniref:Uncharacterized protein n=1 Tax=Larkinella humicola TaxID=2607654 RepID=A0A5N1JL80_9BACT|nr:hypothetical protein [Larkinella humicola]KAA9357245.1 hypothetical protein F0P93_05775 [Larkinella humicola]